MTHNYNFSDYRDFRDLACNRVTLANDVPFTIEAVEADPMNTYAIAYGVTWGLKATSLNTGVEYYTWLDDKGQPVDKACSILQGKVVDNCLRRLARHHYRHYFTCSWETRTRFSTRRYSRDFSSKEEAIEKARKVKTSQPLAEYIRVSEHESWETPDPAPNGTLHASVLDWNIDWWSGFLPWWETER